MFDIKNLHKEKEKFEKVKLKTFKRIFKECKNEIIEMNRCEDVHWHIFDIPYFIQDEPQYDIDECAEYLKLKLIKRGFETEFFEPDKLSISWFPS
jgi:hypothetical protein